MKIEQISNGYLVKTNYEDNELVEHFEDVTGLLRRVLEEYECGGSRHSDKRVYIIEAPGDKNVKFTDAHSDIIWPEEEEEVL